MNSESHAVPKDRRVWLALLALALIGVALRLGFWQMQRAADKTALMNAMEQRRHLPILTAQDLMQAQPKVPEDWWFRPVQLQGQWLHEHSVFLDNRPRQGVAGFWAMTPLQLAPPAQGVIWVKRGWVARDFQDRQRLPTLPSPDGVVTVKGALVAWPSQLYAPGQEGEGRIRQNLARSNMGSWPVERVFDASVVDLSASDDVLQRDAEPLPDLGVMKHHGYAFQWFSLALVLAGLSVWFLWMVPRRKRDATTH